MSKFTKTKKHIELINPKGDEVLAILKMNIQCNLVFRIGANIINFIMLGERTYKGNINLIEIANGDIPAKLEKYDVLLDLIREYLSDGSVLSIQIPIDVFKEKEPLIILYQNFNKNVVQSAVFTDYEDGVFSIKNQPFKNGNPYELYYFEENDSVVALLSDGPEVIYNEFVSVLQIFSNKKK